MFGEVIATQRLTPQVMRVILGGEGLAEFTPSAAADQYVNCFFLPESAQYSVPFDDAEVRALPGVQRPLPRRMTVRAWNEARRELTLDIALHGDVGHAGRWALNAKAGDRLQFRGPGGTYLPHAQADGYVFVGDESALPAICAALEAVPAGRPVTVVCEVQDARGEIELDTPGELEARWVHRAGCEAGRLDHLLADAVASTPLPHGVISAFVHGEAAEVRAVRRVLLGHAIVDEAHLSCSPYWRRGHTDEQWRAVKGAWNREVAAEVFARQAA